jgi:hypothetical protein
MVHMKNFPKINLVQDALHSMAYYIFPKSLRSLEEFRKNPHVKIPRKSPPTNFQSLGKFKNPIFIRNEFFLRIQPTRPSLACAGPLCTAGHRARVLGPSRPAWHWRICQKSSLLRVCAARRRPLLPLSPPRRPTLVKISPRRSPAPRMSPSFCSPPSSLSPLNPLQTEH